MINEFLSDVLSITTIKFRQLIQATPFNKRLLVSPWVMGQLPRLILSPGDVYLLNTLEHGPLTLGNVIIQTICGCGHHLKFAPSLLFWLTLVHNSWHCLANKKVGLQESDEPTKRQPLCYGKGPVFVPLVNLLELLVPLKHGRPRKMYFTVPLAH